LASRLALLARKWPDLAVVCERWEALPEHIKAAVLALVKAAGGA
jgi:hypothetical protein